MAQDEPTITLDPADFAEEEDVKQEAVDTGTTEAESSPEETQPEGNQQTPNEGEAEAPSDPDQEAEPEEQPPEEQPVEKPPVAEQRKEQLNTEIRDLVGQRNALRSEVEQLTSQVYAPRSASQIMAEEGQSASDARITAMEESMQINAYNQQISDAQFQVGTEAQQVLRDFSLFNPTSPDYQPQIAAQAANLLERNLIRDNNVPEYGPNGQPTGKGIVIGVHSSPYELYKTIADAHSLNANAARQQGQIDGQRATEKMLASADPSSSTPPKEKKVDPFLAGLTKGLDGAG
jgi:outer membrane murein-binding lipoprotein Lpp